MNRFAATLLILSALSAHAFAATGTSSGGGSGAPTDATYITQTANGSLSAEQALGGLATGILKNTTTTGVLSIAAAGTDYLAPAAIGVTVQAFDTDLSTYAGITPSANVQSLLGAANYSAMRTLLTLVPGTDVQAFDSDLSSWALITRASGFDTFATTPSGANLASLVTDEQGSGVPVFATSPTITTPNIASILSNGFAIYDSGFSGNRTANVASNVGGGMAGYVLKSGAKILITNTSDANAGNAVAGLTNATNGYWKVTTGTSSDVTNGINVGYLDGSNSKTLTESSATGFVRVACASNAVTAGMIHYTIRANDASDYQARSGSVHFAIVNKAGTETCNIGTVVNEAAALSSGTLTVTFDSDTAPTNAVDIRANAVSSLTQTTLAVDYRVEIFGTAPTITPQ